MSLAKRINFTTTVSLGRLTFQNNQHLLMSVGNSSLVQGVVEIDTSFNILRSQYMHLPKFGGGGNLEPITDSLVYSIGNFLPVKIIVG